MSIPQRKDALPMVGSADTQGATIPPPDTRRSYN